MNLWQDAWALPDNDVQWRALAGSNVEAPFNLNANVPPLRSAVGTVQRLSTAEFPWPAYRLWLWGGALLTILTLLATRTPAPHRHPSQV